MNEIPLFQIEWDESDIEAVSNVIKSGRNWAIGEKNLEFEKLLAEYFDVPYCVSFNSGTSALHAILLVYNIKDNDEVIVPSFTFISTANSVLFTGAKPVFAEIEYNTLGMDPSDVNEKITNKTKAILPVHYAGNPCKIEELKQIAQDNDILLIEDAAESFGAKIGDQKVGTFGDSAMFSFCQNKIITTGEGGCIITNSKEIYNKLKLVRSHGRSENKDYFSSAFGFDYVQLGYNFRMSNILAALGISQLKKIGQLISLRREKARIYEINLKDIEILEIFKPPKDYFHVYQLFTIFVKPELREKLINYLSEKKIGNKIYFDPIHLSKFYISKFGYRQGDFPITEEIANKVLSLPFYPSIERKQIEYIASVIKKFQTEFG